MDRRYAWECLAFAWWLLLVSRAPALACRRRCCAAQGELYPAVCTSDGNTVEVSVSTVDATGVAVSPAAITAITVFMCDVFTWLTSETNSSKRRQVALCDTQGAFWMVQALFACLSLCATRVLFRRSELARSPNAALELKKEVAQSRRMLLTETGLKRLFKLASVGGNGMAASTVLTVLLNLLSEASVVRAMRVSGDPVRLSAVFLHMHRVGVLHHLNRIRQVRYL